jgi:hypothetical protein
MAGKKSSTRNSVLLTQEEGCKLAFEMLRAMEGRAVECSLLLEKCGVRQQNNVALQFLDVLRREGTREAEVGFAKVITDFLAGALRDGYQPMIEQKGERKKPCFPVRGTDDARASNVIPFPKQRAPSSGVCEQ